jgi:hypothetical protein
LSVITDGTKIEKKKKIKKQKASGTLAVNGRRLLEDELWKVVSETVQSNVNVGDDVMVQSNSNIATAAGVSASVAAGAPDAANAAIMVAPDAVEFNVSGPAAAGGRKLLGMDERVASTLRVDAGAGISLKSKKDVVVAAAESASIESGNSVSIQAGLAEASNTVMTVDAAAVQFTVSDHAVTADAGGRKLLTAEERISSMIRIDAAGGIKMKSKKPLQMETQVLQLEVLGPFTALDTLQVEGAVLAKKGLTVDEGLEVKGKVLAKKGLTVDGDEGLEVKGKMLANKGMDVGGALAAKSGLQVPTGEC